MHRAGASTSASPRPAAPLAYFWGDDTFGLRAAVDAFARDARRFPNGAPDQWRPELERTDPGRLLGLLGERLFTGVMFGAGTLAVVRGAGALVRRNEDRDLFLGLLAGIAPGNGLAFAEETESSRRDPPSRTVHEAVRDAGGEVRRIEALREGALAAWIEARARERDVPLGPGAARELATRVGGFVREGDARRGDQAQRAATELDKLALRHVDGAPVTVDDVRELVAEAVPGTMWGFVDAIAQRQRGPALELLERLLPTEPAPVLLAVLHRRMRDLIEAQDRLARGESPGSLVRSMRLQPYPAEKLARQAQGWTADELDSALDGLVELDAQVKGVGGRASSEARDRLAFDLWITDRVAPR